MLRRKEKFAEILNDYFHSVFAEEGTFNGPVVPNENAEGLSNVRVTVNEVKTMMEDLDVRKAQGPDGISNWVLKECSNQLASKIYGIITNSLEQGVVPNDWKRADVVPIYKSGKKEEPSNYRPVSLTSVVAKICERIVKNRWNEYLERNEVINDRQFGFRKGRSCMTNLMCFYSRVIDIVQERDGWADCVYLDLKKAFDKVPHERLLWKLETYGGLKGPLLHWIRDFLRGREMRTVIRNRKSSWRQVVSGVPQGSVLAPVMFAIYVNDMTEGVSSYMSLFADDAKLMRRVERREDCETLQEDLNTIRDWSVLWKMEFNVKKCGVIKFGHSRARPDFSYKLSDETIKAKSEERDLGVIVTDKMSPEVHIRRRTGETYNLVRSIRAAFHYLDEEMIRKLITTMIRPRLEYAAVVWSPSTKKDIRKLERIQRAATKLPSTLSNLPYEERLEKLNLPTLEERRERGDLIALYRILSGFDKLDRGDLVIRDFSSTRGHEKKVKRAACRKDIKKNSFPQRTVGIWNELEKEVVNAKTILDFKEKTG